MGSRIASGRTAALTRRPDGSASGRPGRSAWPPDRPTGVRCLAGRLADEARLRDAPPPRVPLVPTDSSPGNVATCGATIGPSRRLYAAGQLLRTRRKGHDRGRCAAWTGSTEDALRPPGHGNPSLALFGSPYAKFSEDAGLMAAAVATYALPLDLPAPARAASLCLGYASRATPALQRSVASARLSPTSP